MDFVAVETEPRDMELHAFNVRRRLRSGQSRPHTSMATPCHLATLKGGGSGWHWRDDAGEVHALVMELVDGPTLADRIARGPIPIAETLAIATQIATALEAALHFTS